MLTNLHHPAIEACLLPLLLAFGLSGAIRLGTGPEHGRLAAIGMGIAVLISATVILDRALWPPRSGLVKLPYVLLGGLALGVMFDAKPNRVRVPMLLASLWMALVLGWLGWPQLARAATFLDPCRFVFVGFDYVLAGESEFHHRPPISASS